MARDGRRIAAYVAGAAILVLVAGLLYLANFYQPLASGSWTGADTIAPASLFVRIDDDPFGGGAMWVYCYKPGARFAWGTTIRNDGPLPITILGGDAGPLRDVDISQSNGFRLVDFALAPAQPPGRPDPHLAAVMTPATLQPGDEVSIWARFEEGGLAVQAGGTEWMRSLWIRYSVLGVDRTAEVALRDGVGVEALASSSCPPPSAPGAG